MADLSEVREGDAVFSREGGVQVGAVRSAGPNGLYAYIENHGDVALEPGHVRSVHDGKVVLDMSALPAAASQAILNAHSSEDPDL